MKRGGTQAFGDEGSRERQAVDLGCVQVLAFLFGGGESSLGTNIRGFMAESAVSLSFEQDWTCLSKGEAE